MDHRYVLLPAIALVAALSLWGWGWLARRAARASSLPIVATITLGLATVIGLGGLLNLARLAEARSLDAVGLVGLALAGIGAWPVRPRWGRPPDKDALLAAIPWLALFGVLIAWLVPQASYNHNDDLEKYFVHPVKMLALGTLPPNFMGSLGGETLGGQAVLHAFAAAHFPLSHLGNVDAVLGLLLCTAFVAYAFPTGRWAVGAITAELCVVAINPQIVNISSVYSGVALMMAAIHLVARPEPGGRPSAPLLGLVYAALLSLKVSFVPFVALHLIATVIVGPLGDTRSRVRWMALVSAWSAVFVAPWVLLHASLYLAPARPAAVLLSARERFPVNPFSVREMSYGATQLHYTLLALLCVGLALWTGWSWRRRRRAWSWTAASLVAATLAAAGFYFSFAVYFAPRLFSDLSGTRYACPVFLAVVPLALQLFRTGEDGGSSRWRAAIAAALSLAIVAGFWPSLRTRLNQWRKRNTPLAYLAAAGERHQQEYRAYTHEVLFGATPGRLARLQALVPAGEPLGAWVMAPFSLDFRRNPITHLDPAGLAARWARMPADIRYFLLERSGFAVRVPKDYSRMATSAALGDRIIGARALDFLDDLASRSPYAEVIYADRDYILLHWSQPWSPPSVSGAGSGR